MNRLRLLLPPFVRRRVGLQLVVVCGSVLAAAALVSATYTADSQRRVVLAEVERQGQMLVSVLAMCCVEPLLTNDVPALRSYLDALVDADRVAWAEIVRDDGVVVATSGDRVGDGRDYSATVLPPTVAGASPGQSTKLGVVNVELSTAHADSVAHASSRLLFNQWGVAFAALAVALGLVFRFLVHRRLDRLARHAIRFGGGDLDTPIRLGADDEFGQLASTLDDVRVRLRESYRELQERNLQLQELDKLKSEFLANVSHEIRTPLNGILGFTEEILHRDLDAEVVEVMETIFASARTLRSVVDDVLEFSKLEAGAVTILPEPVHLRTLLADVAHLYAPQAWQKGIELVLDVHPTVPGRVLADPLRLRQIVSNLLSNAVKFTQHGEIVVSAQVLEASAPHASLRISVADTGIGFDPSQSERLFESFRQLDGSVSRRYGGTGLGLAIARHLVERMGGTIHADSQPGRGSTFWLDVPLSGAPAGEGDAARIGEHGLVAVIAARKSLRLALAHELRAQGYECTTHEDLPEHLGGPTPAVIVLGLDGAPESHAARIAELRVRLAPQTPRIVAVPPSGVSTSAESLGVDAVLQRPVRAERLRAAMTGTPAKQAVGRTTVAATQRRGRVLVVDDNAVNCRVAGAMLERLGQQVTTVLGGQEAVDLLQAGTEFDLILMDCQMPDVDGFEATRRIRALLGPIAAPPIIACTANNMAGDQERCIAAGMDDYIAKPIDLAGLRRVIDKWMRVPSSQEAAR